VSKVLFFQKTNSKLVAVAIFERVEAVNEGFCEREIGDSFYLRTEPFSYNLISTDEDVFAFLSFRVVVVVVAVSARRLRYFIDIESSVLTTGGCDNRQHSRHRLGRAVIRTFLFKDLKL
jgi:hypothetical protein